MSSESAQEAVGESIPKQAPVTQNTNGTTTANARPPQNPSMMLQNNTGQHIDAALAFQKLAELSEVLRQNMQLTQDIVAGAEELTARTTQDGAPASLEQANAAISAARIADLTRQNQELEALSQGLTREQKENGRLIGEYETAMGNIVEQIRNFGYAKDMEKLKAAKEYNAVLQEEKDGHLATRLERDEWHSKAIDYAQMLREAYRLRCDEDESSLKVIIALQAEVRGYRNALGLRRQKEDEETAYEFLNSLQSPLTEGF